MLSRWLAGFSNQERRGRKVYSFRIVGRYTGSELNATLQLKNIN